MPVVPRAVSREDEGNVQKLTYVRLALATLVFGAAIVMMQIGGTARSTAILYVVLGILCLSTIAAYLWIRAGAPFRALVAGEIVIDCAALTVLMHYGGGPTSALAILYVLPVLFGGACFRVSGGIAAAMLASALLVSYGILAREGYLGAAMVSTASAESPSGMALRWYLYLTVFVFAGMLSGHLSNYVRRRGEELAGKELELRRIQHESESIITNVSSGLIVTNMAGEIVNCNPAAIKILGLSPSEDFKGRLVQDVLPHMNALVQELEGALVTGSARRRHELEVRRSDGTELPLGISISLLRGESGEKRGVVAIFQDLTEVHSMRERVRRADKMAAIGELSTAIAHEIRAPLASICGSIEMLAGELDLSGDNRKLMDLVIKESDRLDRIITDFLEFARLRRPGFEPVDVEACLNEVLMLLKHSSGIGSKVSIEVVSNAPHACIYADDEQIRQVILNLIMNACEAMVDGGRLMIRIDAARSVPRDGSSPAECIVIDFQNNGPAIPDSVLPHVFEPFYTTKEGGTGLGLAIVARIVESHFGHVRVTSSPEHGTTFSVALPVYSGGTRTHTEDFQEEFISF